MPRFKLTVEFAGTRYSGWQKQANARTVQGELERAVRSALGDVLVDCQGAGRTDAGVHALAQVAHVDVVRAPAPEQLRRRLNDELPADVHVLEVTPVTRRFHARHAAVRRSYVYQVSRRRTALAKPYVWWVKEPIDLAPLQAAAVAFVGRHDFRAFTDDDPDEKSSIVVLDEVTVAEAGPLVLIRVAGSHFLWKMVRRMVGVLVGVGVGELPAAAVATWLADPRQARGEPARRTAPAAGLFLERIYYDGDVWPEPLRAPLGIR